MIDARYMHLEVLLRTRGAQQAAAIAAELQVSQPTVSRLLADAGERIVRLGRARAARYALAHEIGRCGSAWPLYRVDANGRPERLGELHALEGQGFYFDSAFARPAFLHGDSAGESFPGLPWFLHDQRPQGFLGRTFANHIAGSMGAPNDILLWRADEIVLALLLRGDDPPGDLVLGEASLQRALRAILTPAEGIRVDQRSERYPQLAEAALRGEDIGSLTGGEQPKFAISLQGDEGHAAVVVKFSDRVDTPNGRRWADLLTCEHHAGEVLHEHGLPAARSEIVETGARTFLQSARFDRTPKLGRCGLVSLAAVDSAFYRHGRIDWWRFAPQLQRDGWLDAEDARRLRVFSWYGAMIANSDMHLGNVALQLIDQRPLPLAPIYDMLPMRFRPAKSGEIVGRRYAITLPTPEHHDDWRTAAPIAQDFWSRVGSDTRISAQFRCIADDAGNALQRALRHLSG